ncbi:hypothetical protein E2562_038380 [Oryza meyeriana var. granulata]|uniref:Uncharacterized protein n=1 Tax=Oryza meyeriana var. granulata TaxID=110450 RepID=A0A6G1DT71_9ORYZ|nr:hypothetical protein E2562_038380 [Oryza meyeriana var. granulata]
MARGKRNQNIRSQDEYLLEERTKQDRSPRRIIASSEPELAFGEILSEGDDDVEINIQDEIPLPFSLGKVDTANYWREVEADELKELLEGQPDLADSSQGKIAWKGDALNQILGEDKHGRSCLDDHVQTPETIDVDGPDTKRKLGNDV